MAKLYKQPYIFNPALACHLAKFERLESISDPIERFEVFRRVPALEYELDIIDKRLTPQQRTSLAQQDRAQKLRSRVTPDGASLEQLIVNVLEKDSWAKKAKEYWAPFIKYLEALGLAPVPGYSSRIPSREQLSYGLTGRRRRLSLRQFENHVSSIRRKCFPVRGN